MRLPCPSFPHVNVYLYSQDGSFSYVYNQNQSNFEAAIQTDGNAKKLENKELVIYADNGRTVEENREPSISFMRAIFDVGANQYGYIEVQSDYKKLDEICNINRIGNVMLMNDRGDIVYPSSPVTENVQQVLSSSPADEKNSMFSVGDHMYFYAASDYSGIKTYIQYPKDTIYSSMRLLQHTTVIFFVCVTLAAILMVVISSRMLVKPLSDLRNSVLAVTYDNMGLSIENVYNNEIVELKDAFQKILDDLKMSAQREIESNKAETRAKLSALQAQISPHFIHNVLYSISIAAGEERTDDARIMCKQLSDMLRYTVNSNAHKVELREEIKCITNYLSLQKQYYEDFLNYHINIQKEAEIIKIPRLSILPFVENAIQHAFEGRKPPYQISVTARISEGSWSVEIEDNGKGFSEEKIKEIEDRFQDESLALDVETKSDDEPGLGGMGILNTVLRLKLFFEGEFEFHIFNHAPEEGSTVRLSGRCDTGDVEKPE